MSWQFLGALGIVFIVAAVLGGGLSVSGVAKVPVVKSFAGFLVLIIGGVVLIGMGYLTWHDRGAGGQDRQENVIVQVVDRVMDSIDGIVGGIGFASFARPELTLSPAAGAKSKPITVAGTGFQKGERVEIRVHVKVVATAQADDHGAFRVKIRIPASSYCPGNQCEVLAQGKQSLKWTTEPYDVL